MFGRATLPTEKTIMDTVNKFNLYGTVLNVHKGHSGRPRTARTPDEVERVQDHFLDAPSTSMRSAGYELDMSRSSIHRIVKSDLKLFPYKIQIFQQLSAGNIATRLAFGRRMIRWLATDKLKADKIWFSDEAHFWLTGHVNKQNHRFWASSNPHVFQTTTMKPQRLSVWCAISSKGIFGPFFFEENLNHEVYVRILRDEFIPFAHGVDAVDDWWFMQDGATAHRTRDVFDLIDEHFHGRVIGLDYESRYGCGIEWPPCSPDLNPCDFWLWGYLKDEVFKSRPRTLDDLKREIIRVVNSIDQETFVRVVKGFENRLEALIDCNGAHFEPYIH